MGHFLALQQRPFAICASHAHHYFVLFYRVNTAAARIVPLTEPTFPAASTVVGNAHFYLFCYERRIRFQLISC
jgi:hypothetical protein